MSNDTKKPAVAPSSVPPKPAPTSVPSSGDLLKKGESGGMTRPAPTTSPGSGKKRFDGL